MGLEGERRRRRRACYAPGTSGGEGATGQCGRPPPPRTLLWVKIRTDARLGIVNLLPLSLDKNMTSRSLGTLTKQL